MRALLAHHLRQQRFRLQLTLAAAAELAGVSQVTLSNLENAKNKDFSLAAVERVCTALGLELAVRVREPRTELEPPPPTLTRRRVRRRS